MHFTVTTTVHREVLQNPWHLVCAVVSILFEGSHSVRLWKPLVWEDWKLVKYPLKNRLVFTNLIALVRRLIGQLGHATGNSEQCGVELLYAVRRSIPAPVETSGWHTAQNPKLILKLTEKDSPEDFLHALAFNPSIFQDTFQLLYFCYTLPALL